MFLVWKTIIVLLLLNCSSIQQSLVALDIVLNELIQVATLLCQTILITLPPVASIPIRLLACPLFLSGHSILFVLFYICTVHICLSAVSQLQSLGELQSHMKNLLEIEQIEIYLTIVLLLVSNCFSVVCKQTFVICTRYYF